jgi:hypothetical protein
MDQLSALRAGNANWQHKYDDLFTSYNKNLDDYDRIKKELAEVRNNDLNDD